MPFKFKAADPWGGGVELIFILVNVKCYIALRFVGQVEERLLLLFQSTRVTPRILRQIDVIVKMKLNHLMLKGFGGRFSNCHLIEGEKH